MNDDATKLLPTLRSAYPGLTKSEKAIALYISEHRDSIMEQSISTIAGATSSAEITVSRFCKKLGFQGLQSLKVALAAEVHSPAVAYQSIQPEDSVRDIAGKMFQNIMDGLQDTLKILDFQAVEKAAKTMMAACCKAVSEGQRKFRRIAIYGFGNSATVCRDMETRFLRFGMVVQAYADSHMQVTSASLLNHRDLAIAISHTGASRDLLETVHVAQSRGAKILAITSYAQSPLAKTADIALIGMGREIHYESEAVASRLVHMAIADLLYMAIAMHMPDKYWENIRRMRKAIGEKK